MWQGQTWVTMKETLLLLVCWLVAHMHPWLTKPTQVPWTGNQPICQVAYISVFCLHTYNYSSWDLISPDVPKKANGFKKGYFFKNITYIVFTPFLLGGWVSCQIFKTGGLIGSQFLEGGCRKRGDDFFQQGERGCSFYIKT